MPKDKVFRPLLNNLRTGLRIGTFRSFDTDKLQVDIRQAVLLSMVGFCVSILFDFIAVGPHRVFTAWGIVSEVKAYALLLLAVYLVVQIQGQLERFGLFVVAILATDPVGSVVGEVYHLIIHHTAVGKHAWSAWGIYLVVWLWVPAVAYWAQRRVFAGSRWRALSASVAYSAFLFGTLLLLPHTRPWHTAYPKDDDRPSIDVEQTYYAQPALLNAELSRLKPQRSGIHDIYFVGVAGYAEQNVFLREVRSIRKLFDRRYGTAGRSILLINNPATVKTVPLADASNLKIVLDRIGRLMNPKEDMLFLYITSHGSEDKTIAFDYWPLSLDDLTAKRLHDILTGSRIGWRTVVLSSCFSGGFIDSLKNPDAMVMTAAAANRTSFGCSNENAWTYFGDAYFHQALAHTPYFIKAFDQAKVSIAKREAQEKLTPSNPQIWVGRKIAKFLPQIETRLAALSGKSALPVADCSGGKSPGQSRCRH